MKAHLLLSNEDAERIGAELAADFGLARSSEHRDRWQTENGTFTNKGIARRALRIIEDGARASEHVWRTQCSDNGRAAMSRKQLAIAIKRKFGVRYNINGANIFVRGHIDLGLLFGWLKTVVPGGGVRMSTCNPHFRASYFTTPFWLCLYVEHAL